MTGDQTAHIVWYVLALTLVGSALLSRRINLKSAAGMILAWIAIFAVVLILFSYRQELGLMVGRVQGEVLGTPRQHVEGSAIHIAMASDGHYWVEGRIGATQVRFLVDSGASITALSETTAREASLTIDQQRIATIDTANGPVNAKYSSIPELSVGAIRANDLTAIVSPNFGDINVLGMNFLSQLKTWRVENGEMILVPR
jgi:aspartyl protease family protein